MKILFVVDLQKQFKDENGKYDKCLKFIEENKDNYDSIVATVFTQDLYGVRNPNFVRNLNYTDCAKSSKEDLEFYDKSTRVVFKNGYGVPSVCFADNDDIIDVIGCDTDACLLACCFQLWDTHKNFRVLTDYIYSVGDVDGDYALRLLKRNFGKCII